MDSGHMDRSGGVVLTRHRNYCFTLNNYTNEHIELLRNSGIHNYIIFGKEIGKNGTPHLQGYIELKRRYTLQALKKELNINTIHLEQRKGTQAQAIKYCMKDNDYEEIGETKKQGRRTDLEKVSDMLKEGATIKQVVEQHTETFIKYHKGIEKARQYLIMDRSVKPEVIIYYGKTGVGKSKRAYEETNDAYTYGPEMGTWWDGYDGHKHVIMDEFNGNLPFKYLLRLLDKYPMRVQTKGGTAKFIAEKIIITSSVHPKEWYHLNNIDGKIDQLLRRLDQIIELNII